jgi:hypothetical protein
MGDKVVPPKQNNFGALLPTAVIFFIGTVLEEFRGFLAKGYLVQIPSIAPLPPRRRHIPS